MICRSWKNCTPKNNKNKKALLLSVFPRELRRTLKKYDPGTWVLLLMRSELGSCKPITLQLERAIIWWPCSHVVWNASSTTPGHDNDLIPDTSCFESFWIRYRITLKLEFELPFCFVAHDFSKNWWWVEDITDLWPCFFSGGSKYYRGQTSNLSSDPDPEARPCCDLRPDD